MGSRVVRRPPAVEAALELLAGFPAGDAVSVITVSSPARRVLGQPSFDRRAIRDRLESIQPTQRSTDLAGGLTAALEVLRDSPAAPANRAVYVISDQAAAAWRADDQNPATAARLAEEAALALVPTAERQRGNRAVTSLTCSDSLPAARRPIRLRAVVVNLDDTPARDLVLQVRGDDRIIRRIPLEPLEAGGQREVAFSIAFQTAGVHAVETRLDAPTPDALPDDDVRHLSLEVFESVPVLLVDGRPGPGRLSGEAGYLAAALAPEGEPGAPVLLQPEVIAEWELPGQAMPAYRLIALCNVHGLAEALWRRLEAFVRGGGGLLVFLGDATGDDMATRDNFNRFGYANGRGLLPAKLGPAVGNAERRDTYVRFWPERFVHPAVAQFARADRSGLFVKGRIYRFISVDADPSVATVLLRYAGSDAAHSGEPAVLERSFGAGRTCLVTTTANMAWNNLPARGDFVSLVWGLAGHVAAQENPARNLIIGQSIAEPLPPEVARAAERSGSGPRVTVPDATADHARITAATDAGYELCYGPVQQAGIYAAAIGSRRIVFAANLDPLESDLAILDEPALRALLKCPLVYLTDPEHVRPRFGGGTEELSRSLLYLVVLLAVCESWLAMRFAARE